MQQDLSSDMDRLTQLQDAIEDLFTIASATLSYLTTRPSFQPLHPDLPVTFKSPHADPRAVVEASKRELLADLVRKAKQVEYLVGVLPERETDGGAAHERRLSALQAEADAINEEYAAAVKEAEQLLDEIKSALNQILDPALPTLSPPPPASVSADNQKAELA